MTTDYEIQDCTPQKNKEIFDKLNSTVYQDSKTPEYWLWSDLKSLYPEFLGNSSHIPTDWFTDKLHTTITQNVSAFKYMITKPTHIKTIVTDNSNSDPDYSYDINTESNLDQKLTRLACEFLFKQYRGTEFTQAYFLFPNASFDELTDKTDDIKIYRKHQDVNNVVKKLAAIILRTTGRTKATVCEVFESTWAYFFDVKDLGILRQKYNIDRSPLDHMQPDQWRRIYYMFNDMVNFLDPHAILELDEVIKQCKESAGIGRRAFEIEGHTPEEFLYDINFGIQSKQIDQERKQFWFKNYEKSL